jgi:hypothetical protein
MKTERRYQDRKDAMERSEQHFSNRLRERQLLDERASFEDAALPETRDERFDAPAHDESWALGNQLMNGPRLRPHRGASELHGAAQESAEAGAWDKLQSTRRAIRRGS